MNFLYMSAAVFKKKCLVPSSRVCLRLKQLRLESNTSLDELEKRTKISKKNLQAVEECRFDELKYSSLYQKNFIKKYVRALGKDPEPFLEQFCEEELKYKNKCTKHPNTGYKKYHLSNLPSLLRFLLVGTVVLTLLLYLGSNIQNILKPPELIINSPENGYITEDTIIVVAGKTEPEVKITINGETIMNDENGGFNQPVSLSPGINTLVIKAEKKHGKTTEETRHVICKNTKSLSLNKVNSTR